MNRLRRLPPAICAFHLGFSLLTDNSRDKPGSGARVASRFGWSGLSGPGFEAAPKGRGMTIPCPSFTVCGFTFQVHLAGRFFPRPGSPGICAGYCYRPATLAELGVGQFRQVSLWGKARRRQPMPLSKVTAPGATGVGKGSELGRWRWPPVLPYCPAGAVNPSL